MPPKPGSRKRVNSAGASGHSVNDASLAAVDLASLSSSQPQPSTSGATKRRKQEQLIGKTASNTDNKASDNAENAAIDAIAELHVLLTEQKTEISALRDTVAKQQSQIDTLLALLGLTPDHEPRSVGPVGPSTSQSSGGAAVPPKRSLADVVRNAPVLPAPMKQAVAAAVYHDIKQHERRARNIVVSGLPTVANNDDAQASQLLESEFGTKPSIVKCRRLGKLQPNKIQPLLITLGSDSEAEHYINRAKQLRKSANHYNRQSVFINRDVTRAEAQAAYLDRCERRQRAADFERRRSSTALSSTAQSAPPPPEDSTAAMDDSVAPSPTTGIDAQTNIFVPTAAASTVPAPSTNVLSSQ